MSCSDDSIIDLSSESEAEEENDRQEYDDDAVVDEQNVEDVILVSEYDEYDEEEDEELYERSGKKKKKVERYGGFIIDEAEVDDEVEEEDEWEEGPVDTSIVANEEDESGPTAREIEGHRRGNDLWDSKNEDEIEEYLRRKYSDDTSVAIKHFGNAGVGLISEITKQTLLPGVKDPNLWMVKCRIGEEKQTALLLMRKTIAYQFTDNPLQIKSAVSPEGVKGYIYIEAYKQTHVKSAIENISSLKMGIWKQQIVPINEMTDILKVVKIQSSFQPKQWVRFKKGYYKDDIAQVDYMNMAQSNVHLKLIPRIDYTKLRGALRSTMGPDYLKRKRRRRPGAKLFDPEAVRAIGGEVTSDGDFMVFEGNRYNRKGFLFKDFYINLISTEEVQPTLSELEKFEDATENEDIAVPIINTDNSANNQAISGGDNVEVCTGELINLRGKVLSIDGNMVTIMPEHKDLKLPLEFTANELCKYFKQGDHVRVLGGRFKGDTGLVVRVTHKCVVMFSDVSMHEMEVLPRDLQLCKDTASGVDSIGQFQWGDLVQLDLNNVGVIVRIEHEKVQVLSMTGKLIKAKSQTLLKKKEHKNTIGVDAHGNSLQRKDVIKVIDGPHTGMQGEIQHLYRHHVFLYSRLMTNNGGIFVCRLRHVTLAGNSIDKSTSLQNGSSTLGITSPRHIPGCPSGYGRYGGGVSYESRKFDGVRRDKELIGQTIRITSGPYKGAVGMVKDSTECTARVELHSPCQTISVDKRNIMMVGGQQSKDRRTMPSSTKTSLNVVPMTPSYREGGKTPMYGSMTPSYEVGSRTPAYGNMTPSHDTTISSLAWDPAAGYTPARDSDTDHSYQLDHNYSPFEPESPSSCEFNGNNPFLNALSPTHVSPLNIDYHPRPSPSSYYPFLMTSSPSSSPGPAAPFLTLFDLPSGWHTTGVYVHITDSELAAKTGIVKKVEDSTCTVYLPDNGQTVTVDNEKLEPVMPKLNDFVKILCNQHKDKIGNMVAIEGSEGLVVLHDEKNPLLFPLVHLCRAI
ncbi:transcription elongation factor SPT5-like isoform X2 [Adelges cooleyi]|uniref:transcription elongation factor SPT5-like isoform X2 n=1 Tax=Adelges cooleyi TaxID=133065 RepID=UPI00217FF4A9|nr:transcription elongation factor SPT5-like isoform X2 [Adelges cooleyi]